MKKAFTLIELSVVLVVIGLLLASVAAGTKLLKQSELRAVIVSLKDLETRYSSFVLNYNGIPGDHEGMQAFFPSGCAQTASNCNGNGNGNIETSTDSSDEIPKSFIHLSLAELIDKPIPFVLPDAHDGSNFDYGIDSSIRGAQFFYGGRNTTLDDITGYSSLFSDEIAVYLGAYNSTSLRYNNGAIRAADAYHIDVKLDDGKITGSSPIGAETGKFRASEGVDGLDCTILVSGTYILLADTKGCVIGYAVE